MSVVMFPGQGSQKKGMGDELFERYKNYTDIADSVLGYSIRELCIEDPHNRLGITEYTQPAIFTVNALMYLDMVDKNGKEPEYAAGHSLGEYNALFAAGAFDFSTGLRLVQKRGELMSKASGGGMAAVIGLNETEITSIIENNYLRGISIANYNSSSQIVITGPNDSIINCQQIFEENGAKMYIPLKVSGAFHSGYMQTAAEEFSAFMEQFDFNGLKTTVISNTYASPYSFDKIKETLIDQITKPVRWEESIRYLIRMGETDFIETGPGKVLTNLLKQILRG